MNYKSKSSRKLRLMPREKQVSRRNYLFLLLQITILLHINDIVQKRKGYFA